MTEFFMPMKVPTTTYQEKKLAVRNANRTFAQSPQKGGKDAAQQRATGGKPYTYEPPAVKDTREKLTAHLARFAPAEPFEGALRLTVKWLFPCGRSHKDGEYKITKPDTDNLIKLLKDCMTALHFWNDDAQVASEINEKFHADRTGIYIRLEELYEDRGS